MGSAGCRDEMVTGFGAASEVVDVLCLVFFFVCVQPTDEIKTSKSIHENWY